jgi:hypothetical protein
MRLRSGICTGSERCVWHEMQDQTVSSSAVGRVLKGAKPVDLPILILHLATIEAHRSQAAPATRRGASPPTWRS